LENLKRLDHLGDVGLDAIIKLKWILVEYGMTVCIGLSWQRIRTGDVQLGT
jgi:hypothetical protein